MNKVIFLVAILVSLSAAVSASKSRLPTCSPCKSDRQCACGKCWGDSPVTAKCGSLSEQKKSGCYKAVCKKCTCDSQCASGKCYKGKCGTKSDQMEAHCDCDRDLLPVCEECKRDSQCASGKCWGPKDGTPLCGTKKQQIKGMCFDEVRPSPMPMMYDS